MATKQDPYLVCKASFHCPDGFIATGDIYEADHKIVKKYPDRFKELTVHRVGRSTVEQATAAPGEKRDR